MTKLGSFTTCESARATPSGAHLEQFGRYMRAAAYFNRVAASAAAEPASAVGGLFRRSRGRWAEKRSRIRRGPLSTRTLSALLLTTALAAWAADERTDHRGSIGLIVSTGGEFKSSIAGAVAENGLRLPLHVGGTLAIGDNGNELKALLDASWFGPALDLGFTLGYRGYFAVDRMKTFFDADLGVRLVSHFSIGPEVGVGLQYELTSVVGIFTNLRGKLGFGQGLRLGGELLVGIQFRSYLLE